VDPEGRPVTLRVVGSGTWSLVLFLSTNCDGCVPFWKLLGDQHAAGFERDLRVVAVTRDPGEQDAAALAAVPGGSPVVMSTDAWRAYRVQGPPFYVLVDGSASPEPGEAGVRVAAEGVAWGVSQVADHVRRVRADAAGTPTAGEAEAR
jgi:hypothetical protein